MRNLAAASLARHGTLLSRHQRRSSARLNITRTTRQPDIYHAMRAAFMGRRRRDDGRAPGAAALFAWCSDSVDGVL